MKIYAKVNVLILPLLDLMAIANRSVWLVMITAQTVLTLQPTALVVPLEALNWESLLVVLVPVVSSIWDQINANTAT